MPCEYCHNEKSELLIKSYENFDKDFTKLLHIFGFANFNKLLCELMERYSFKHKMNKDGTVIVFSEKAKVFILRAIHNIQLKKDQLHSFSISYSIPERVYTEESNRLVRPNILYSNKRVENNYCIRVTYEKRYCKFSIREIELTEQLKLEKEVDSITAGIRKKVAPQREYEDKHLSVYYTTNDDPNNDTLLYVFNIFNAVNRRDKQVSAKRFVKPEIASYIHLSWQVGINKDLDIEGGMFDK